MITDSLQRIYSRLLDKVSNLKHYRYLYPKFNLNDRLTGLTGPRGTGKTTLMLQYIKNHFPTDKTAFYFSADHIYFENTTLYQFVEELYLTQGTTTFFIDEIHKYKRWSQELKNLYDGFPDLRIVFSGSSSLDLAKGSHDLSRRAKMFHLAGLSFREYLSMKLDTTSLPVIEWKELINNHHQYDALLNRIPGILGHFNEYLQQGVYPFYHDNPVSYYEKLLEVIDNTIYEDIANFYSLKTVNLHHFRKLLNFLASTPPGGLSVHALAKNLSVDDKTIIIYLNYLAENGLVNVVYSKSDQNPGLRRPEKIFLDNTNLHYAINGQIDANIDIGSIRELFFIQAVTHSNRGVFHSKQGDYLVDGVTFEIGGRNKTTKQIRDVDSSFVVKADVLTSRLREIPLLMFGFLY